MVETADVTADVTLNSLYRGYVGLEAVDQLEEELAAILAVLQKRPLTDEDFAAAGFSDEYRHKNHGPTLAQLCATPLRALSQAIVELRSEAETFPNNPNMAIRTGSSAIPDSMLMRDLPRAAFFRSGLPIWLHDASSGV